MEQLYRDQVACDVGQFDQIVGATLGLIIANAASSDAPPCRIAPPASPAIEPGNPLLHIGTALEQIGALLPAIFAATTQLLEGVQPRRRLRLVQFQPVELDEITVADRGDDFAGAEMLMFSAIQDQEHANDRVCCGLFAQSLVPFPCAAR